MTLKSYLSIATVAVLLSSCLKQSIADAMLNGSGGKKVTATLRYEINGSPVTVSVEDADRQVAGSRRLSCEKSNGYVLSAVLDYGDFVFTFYTDSLKPGNYKYAGNFGPLYITTFQGRAHYVYSPTDNMDFTVTAVRDGHISGNFSGRLTPANSNNGYGASGSVIIKNGSFTDVPIFY